MKYYINFDEKGRVIDYGWGTGDIEVFGGGISETTIYTDKSEFLSILSDSGFEPIMEANDESIV